MAAADVEERIDALYGLPNEEFVAARDALAKELRAQKRREEAREVAALRRPSQADWAVAQVVRSQPAPVRALWAAGDELIAAQDAVMAGEGDPARLRAAMARRRDALGPVSQALRGLLTGKGKELGEATVQEAIETFTAASVDGELRERVAGRRASGPAEAAPTPAPAGEKPRPKPAAKKPAPSKAKEERRRRDARLAAQRDLEAAEGDRATAARRAEAARQRLEEAEAAAADARERLEAAEAAEAAARAALERLAG